MKKRKYIILGIVTVLLVAVTVVLAYRMQQEKKKEASEMILLHEKSVAGHILLIKGKNINTITICGRFFLWELTRRMK